MDVATSATRPPEKTIAGPPVDTGSCRPRPPPPPSPVTKIPDSGTVNIPVSPLSMTADVVLSPSVSAGLISSPLSAGGVPSSPTFVFPAGESTASVPSNEAVPIVVSSPASTCSATETTLLPPDNSKSDCMPVEQSVEQVPDSVSGINGSLPEAMPLLEDLNFQKCRTQSSSPNTPPVELSSVSASPLATSPPIEGASSQRKRLFSSSSGPPPAVLPKPNRTSSIRPCQPPPARPSQLPPPPPMCAAPPPLMDTPELPPPPPSDELLAIPDISEDFPAPPESIIETETHSEQTEPDPLSALESLPNSDSGLVSPLILSPGPATVLNNVHKQVSHDNQSMASSASSSLDSAIFSSATTTEESIRSHTPQPGSLNFQLTPGNKCFVPTPATTPPSWVKTSTADPIIQNNATSADKVGPRVSVRETSTFLEGVLRLQQPEDASQSSFSEKSPRIPTISTLKEERLIDGVAMPLISPSMSMSPRNGSDGRPATPDSALLSAPSVSVPSSLSGPPPSSSFHSETSSRRDGVSELDAALTARPGAVGETVPVVLGDIRNMNRKESQMLTTRRRPNRMDDMMEHGVLVGEEPYRRVTFQGGLPAEDGRPAIRVERRDPTGASERTGLGPDDVMQTRTFYQGNKTDVHVCKCLATLYWAKEAPEIGVSDWTAAYVGIALLVVNRGDGRRPKGVTFTFAEKGTGFLLWSAPMLWNSQYTTVETNFHRFRDATTQNRAVGLAFQDADSAEEFRLYLKSLGEDKEENLFLDPNIKISKKQKKLLKRNSVSSGKLKKRLPGKANISHPCQFTHVTQLKRAEEDGEILALTMVPYIE